MRDGLAAGAAQHPEYDRPPLVEVALGIQFEALPRLRPIELAPLRDRWAEDYPVVQEQPPVPPALEAATVAQPQIQLVIGPSTLTRLWFLKGDGTELVQLQNDRLTVNWRRAVPEAAYPRYEAVRDLFRRRFEDVAAFLDSRHLGAMDVTQVEVNYVNALDVEEDELGRLELVLRDWSPDGHHHLGAAQQARALHVYGVPDVGRDPVRMYVAANPAQRPNGRPALLFTFTVRGAPDEAGLEGAMGFMDRAHDHVLRSFAELTPVVAQEQWGRR